MPGKNSKSVATKARSNNANLVKFVDREGRPQVIDPAKVKNLGDTAYAASQTLFPDSERAFLGKPDKVTGVIPAFNAEGYPNILNENIILVDAVRMTKGDYGPWFLTRAQHPKLGDISFPASGEVLNKAISQLSGISLTTGDQVKASEFPVWARIEWMDEGKYDGYFALTPALTELVEVDDDEA